MNDIYRQVGQRIQQARRAKSWTQEDLAHHAGLDFSYVNQLENGKRNPSLATLYKVATALGVSLKRPYSRLTFRAWLLTGSRARRSGVYTTLRYLILAPEERRAPEA